MQIARFHQRVIIDRGRARQAEAVALHGQGVANQKAGRIFCPALHGAGEVVIRVRLVHEAHRALVDGNHSGFGAIGDQMREALLRAVGML